MVLPDQVLPMINYPCLNGCRGSDTLRREQIISYMADLMEDNTDFSWQGAEAAQPSCVVSWGKAW